MRAIIPNLAPVRPRVYGSESGETLPIEEAVQPFLSHRAKGAIRLVGGPGSGKTTALAHLAAVLPQSSQLLICEDPTRSEIEAGTGDCLVVYAAPSACAEHHLAVLELAPWGRDEQIEYLLAVHKDRCASVLARLQAQRVPFDCGNPQVWRIVLDALAGEEALPDARSALIRHCQTRVADAALFELLEQVCLEAEWTTLQWNTDALRRLADHLAETSVFGLLQHAVVRGHLATDRMVRELRQAQKCTFLCRRLSRELIKMAAPAIRIDERAQQSLRLFLTKVGARHPMAASLLHQAGTGWVPGRTRHLAGAYLDGAAWPDVVLSRANLDQADLSASYLCRGDLSEASALGTNFSRARLDHANLRGLVADLANFAHATLRVAQAESARFHGANLTGAVAEDASLELAQFNGANLTRANFSGAHLRRATFSEAAIAGADFTGADFTFARLAGLCLREANFAGVCLAGANLEECDLESMDLTGVDFAVANLSAALLTGCEMAETDFTGARLRNAGLADINWEGACLRDADLTGASFHMGGSRSGRVGSLYPCEGSKTGFYTDEFEEQHFKSPEEIRKANLRRADLRGARLDHVDFYLVDLRDALFDPEQERVLRQSGAILQDWRCRGE